MGRFATAAGTDRLRLPALGDTRVRCRRVVPESRAARASLAAVALCVVASALGCYALSPYTGSYYLPPGVATCPIEDELAEVLKPFGATDALRRGPNGYLVWYFERRRAEPRFSQLSGSKSIVTVACGPRFITVRDHEGSNETPFVRAIRDVVEEELRAIGVTDPKFERQIDIFS